MRVLGKPIASIFPLTAVVKRGETTTVQCTVTSNPTEVRDMQWYKDGYMFDGSQGEILISSVYVLMGPFKILSFIGIF